MAKSEKEARGSRTSATSETLGTVDTTATTESASISKDNSQHARSIGNAGVSKKVRNEMRDASIIVMHAIARSRNVKNSIDAEKQICPIVQQCPKFISNDIVTHSSIRNISKSNDEKKFATQYSFQNLL